MLSNTLTIAAFSTLSIGVLAVGGILSPLLAAALTLIVAAIYLFQTAPRALIRIIIITTIIIGVSLTTRHLPLSPTIRLAIGLIFTTGTLSLLLPRPKEPRQSE